MPTSVLNFISLAGAAISAAIVLVKPTNASDRCGRRLIIRPIRRSDQGRMRRALERLTPTQVRDRFFCRMNGFSADFVRGLCDPEPATCAAFVVTDRRGKDIVGEARLSWSGDARRAQFALFVDPAATTLGIGHLLMNRLIDECHRRNIFELHGDVLERNRAMLMFLRGLGHDLVIENGGEPGIAHARLRVPRTANGTSVHTHADIDVRLVRH